MDRRNGGDSLAPPRPPKSLPRIHRPRAPEPAIMSVPLTPTITSTTTTTTPILLPRQQHQQQEPNNTQSQQLGTNNHLHQPIRRSNSHIQNNNNNNNNNNSNNQIIINRNNNYNSSNNSINNNNNNNNVIQAPQREIITAPLIPLQLQQQNHNSIINNNNNNSLSSSTTITSTNSFTRRRPPPIIPLIPSSSSSLPSSYNIIVQNIIEPPVSPVTLAAPRPENERLANEYVDTPFRPASAATTQSSSATNPLLLHQTSRNQHPAGQNIHGQTTTQHNLLYNQRQQQQQHHHHQQNHQHNSSSHHQHSNNNNSNVTSNILPTIIGGIGGGSGESGGGGILFDTSTILHSNINSHKEFNTIQTTTATTTTQSGCSSNVRQNQLINNNRSTTTLNSTLPITQAITKQPIPFSKEHLPASILHEEVDLIGGGGIGTNSTNLSGISGLISNNNGGDSLNSITCPQCKKCRCEQCQSPRQLPSRWVCNKTCLCSAETVIDYASCLCCVKALFYHCSKDHEMECDDGDSISCADNPCSCLPHKRTTRWGWLGALSLALPCLWCYWPMRGCVALCAKCYATHSRHGCRCQQSQIGSTSSMLPIVPISNGSGNIINTKSSGVSGGVHSGISGSGIGNHNCSNNTGRIIRTCDLTPEKRLLDSSSPEY